MKLFEIFKSPLPYKIEVNDEDLFVATFQDQDGNTYRFYMNNTTGNTKGISTWTATFNSTEKETGPLTFLIVGGRNPFLVFSTIADIFTQAVKSTGANRIYFTADKSESSRVSLYNKLTPLLARHLGWNYTNVFPNTTNEVIFAIGQPGVDLEDKNVLRSLYDLNYEDDDDEDED